MQELMKETLISKCSKTNAVKYIEMYFICSVPLICRTFIAVPIGREYVLWDTYCGGTFSLACCTYTLVLASSEANQGT